MKKYLCIALLNTSCLATAAGTLDYLEVDNDVVLFSTTQPKSASSPSCMTQINSNLWSASLSSDSGRAIYSLILTSMVKGEGVGLSIESAQDCNAQEGVERAAKVKLTATAISATPANSGSRFGVYNWDGSSRLGTLVELSAVTTWFYLEAGGDGIPKQVKPASYGNLFFSGENCTGNPLTNSGSTVMKNPYFQDGKYFSRGTGRSSYSPKSQRYPSGNCQNGGWNGTFYDVIPGYVDPACGVKDCILKEE